MPGYPGNALAKLLRDNQQAYLWQNETISAGAGVPASLSISFQLERINRTFYPWGCSFEAVFAGNPGAFEIDIMGANLDNAANYIVLGSITVVSSIVAGSYTGRWDMPSNIWVRYVAAYMKTLTNTVAVTLQATR